MIDLRADADVDAYVRKVASSTGFAFYLIGYVNPEISDQPWLMYNYPNLLADIPDADERDPLLKRVRSKAETIAWGPELFYSTGNGDIWEAGRAFGIHSGISCPIRPGGVRRMQIAMMRDAPFDGTPEQLREQAESLERITHMVAGTVVQLRDSITELAAYLSPIELEGLKWTFEGLSEYEVARKLHMGTTQTIQLLKIASSTLGVPTAIEASIIAARLGLIR